MQQSQAKEAEAVAEARRIAAREAREVLERVKREEEAEKARRRESAAQKLAAAAVEKGKGFALTALNFLADQLSKTDAARAETQAKSTPEAVRVLCIIRVCDAMRCYL